jgi:DNA processing protein
MSDELHARLALCLTTEPGDQRTAALVAACGAEQALALHPSRDQLLRSAADLAERCRRDRIGILVPGTPGWATQLDQLAAPPLVLFTTGAPLREQLLRSVAVVGSRAATASGLRTAHRWSADLASAGFAVVSGGAFGIDAAAHAGGLAGGRTVAVLAAGVDVDSPQGNAQLLRRIRRAGTVVSEVPPGTPPARHRFIVRNRIIAALTPGTLVVEAASRSGALATARHAHALHRIVMAVPGPVDSPLSQGCHDLVANAEAALVSRPGEVAELLLPLTAAPAC